jgi:hypothetical protein
MTLNTRNGFLSAGIVFSLLMLIALVISSWWALPGYPLMSAKAAERAQGLFLHYLARFVPAAPYAPYVSSCIMCFFAPLALVLIKRLFEKTQAPEMPFIAFFCFSFCLEGFQILLPLGLRFNLPGIFLTMAYRVQLLGRCFGLYSLFIAGVLAAGLQVKHYLMLIIVCLATALMVALGIPVDSNAWDTSLDMINGYQGIVHLSDMAVIIITVLSFLVASRTRDSREYRWTALGAVMVFVGRECLIRADTWLLPLPGFVLLLCGAWFMGSSIHKIYLWL